MKNLIPSYTITIEDTTTKETLYTSSNLSDIEEQRHILKKKYKAYRSMAIVTRNNEGLLLNWLPIR